MKNKILILFTVLFNMLIYSQELQEGLNLSFYENGQLEKKINLKNGVIQGESLAYYENGALKSKVNFVDGKLHGDRRLIDPDPG